MTDPKNLWKDQPVSVAAIPVDDLRLRLRKQQGMLRRRNLTEYIAAAVVAVLFGARLFGDEGVVTKVGAVMVVIGVATAMWQLHRRASAGREPADAGTEGLVAFQRAELTRQRDALRSVGLWYLGPMIPGMLVCLAGPAFEGPVTLVGLAGAALGALIAAAIFGGIWKLNHTAARRLDQQIQDLDRSETL